MQLPSSPITLQSPKYPFLLPHPSPHTFSFSPPTPSSHFSSNNNKTTTFSVRCRHSDYFEPQQKKFTPKASYEDSFSQKQQQQQPLGALPPRVYVGYSIYKGKAALSIEPKPPEFASLGSGSYKVSKEGFVLLQFAPAVGSRQYDWSNKQLFSLSVSEIGALIGLGAKGSCEFFHDPNKGRSDEGKVRKVFKAEPLPDGSGHFFNLSVQNKLVNVDESIYIPISKAELTVMVSALNYILPFLLGWHAFADSINPEDSVRNANSPAGAADVEWSR